MKDDSGHTADEYTENETIKKLIKSNKEEVRLDSRNTRLTLPTQRPMLRRNCFASKIQLGVF